MTSSMISTFWGHIGGEPRIRYLPTANVLVTLPETNDRVVLRPFDLVEALQHSGEDFLVVLSAASTRAATGASYTYQVDAISKAGGVRYSLESGPPGMNVSDAGLVQWPAPSRHDGPVVHVVLKLHGASGKDLFHAFDIQVQ